MDNDSVIGRKATKFQRKILRRIRGPVCEDDLSWRLRHNKELYELLDGPEIVKIIKLKRLQWAGHIARMDNARLPKKCWMENSMEEDLWEDHD
jgi:hypothetical protein